MVGTNQRVVLVTGASSGIGKRCCELLSSRGFRVYGAARRAEALREGTNTDFVYLRMDVTSGDSVREACDEILRREGRLDIAINNAGMGFAGAIEDTSVQEALDQFDVNFFGALRVCQTVLPIMRKQKSGYILNIGSIAGLIAIPYQGLYSASKFALEGLTEALRLEVRGFGIRVVLIEPGDHRTPFTHHRRFTAESSGNPAYRASFEHVVQRMASDEQGGPDPERLAQLVHDVVNTDNPRLRYTAGQSSQRVAVWLKRLAPYAIVEKVIKSHYFG